MLEQDGQLVKLGEQLLEVVVAPRKPIVSSIFRKVLDQENPARRRGRTGSRSGALVRTAGGERVGGGQQARRARRGGDLKACGVDSFLRTPIWWDSFAGERIHTKKW